MTPKSEFIRLIDRAIEEAEKIVFTFHDGCESWKARDAQVAKTIFERIKSDVIEDALPVSRGGGLGITRGLSDWNAPSALYDAGREVELFYRENWK